MTEFLISTDKHRSVVDEKLWIYVKDLAIVLDFPDSDDLEPEIRVWHGDELLGKTVLPREALG